VRIYFLGLNEEGLSGLTIDAQATLHQASREAISRVGS